jgi:hypothetical protein
MLLLFLQIPLSSSQQQYHQDDQQNGTKTTANEWAAKVKATATEQDEKYDDKDDGVHCNPSRFTDERALGAWRRKPARADCG